MNMASAQSGSGQYSFFVAGHTSSYRGLHQPFKQKFAYIQNRAEIEFGVFTGDIVSSMPEALHWDKVDVDIDSLGLPVYFAAGNHDMENRPLFESRYGNTYYSFIHKNDLFIVLDPNIDEWNISGKQLQFLKNITNSLSQSVSNIFVFFHQLLWWENNNVYAEVIPNSLEGRADTINFWTDIEPLFHQLPNPVVMFAGDLGAGAWSSDFMYDSYDNISLIGSGMGEGIGDNMVVVNVDSTKNISYDLICLNDSILHCFGELTDYDIISTVNRKNINTRAMSIYPNPATTHVTIETGVGNESTIQMYNMRGQLIVEEQSEGYKHTINLLKLKRGLYILKVTNNSSFSTRKLIVK
jgi:hypothetical protein